jgi:hypothetical protein
MKAPRRCQASTLRSSSPSPSATSSLRSRSTSEMQHSKLVSPHRFRSSLVRSTKRTLPKSPLKRSRSPLTSLRRSYARRGTVIPRARRSDALWLTTRRETLLPSIVISSQESSSEDEDEDEHDLLTSDTEDDTSCSHTHVIPHDTSCGSTLSHVRFAPRPEVVEIPSHRAYSHKEKAQIWNSLPKLRKEAKRNRIEWIWEGSTASQAVEEEDFWTNARGKLVHPAHFENVEDPVQPQWM